VEEGERCKAALKIVNDNRNNMYSEMLAFKDIYEGN
jgi:hypothetical protein